MVYSLYNPYSIYFKMVVDNPNVFLGALGYPMFYLVQDGSVRTCVYIYIHIIVYIYT